MRRFLFTNHPLATNPQMLRTRLLTMPSSKGQSKPGLDAFVVILEPVKLFHITLDFCVPFPHTEYHQQVTSRNKTIHAFQALSSSSHGKLKKQNKIEYVDSTVGKSYPDWLCKSPIPPSQYKLS